MIARNPISWNTPSRYEHGLKTKHSFTHIKLVTYSCKIQATEHSWTFEQIIEDDNTTVYAVLFDVDLVIKSILGPEVDGLI